MPSYSMQVVRYRLGSDPQYLHLRETRVHRSHNIKQNRLGDCECILDVDDDNEEFWSLLGGKGDIKTSKEESTVVYTRMLTRRCLVFLIRKVQFK